MGLSSKNKQEAKRLQVNVSTSTTATKSQKKATIEKGKKQSERLRQLNRSIENKNKQIIRQKKGEAAPVEVVQAIKYQKMYEDGICKVENGLYSKTMRFSDINYQLARRDDQIEIFSRYCELLNSFEPNSDMQITIHNRHIDDDEFKANMLMQTGKGTDDLDEYRNEYNTMLLTKAMQGQNSLVREKYITYTVPAADYKEAVQKLSNTETALVTNFKSLGCETTIQTGAERLEYIHDMFSPHERINFDYDYLMDSGLSSKSLIAPDSFNFSDKNVMEIGDSYGQLLYVKIYPSDMSDKFLAEIVDVPCNLTITMHIQQIEQSKATNLVNLHIALAEVDKINYQKKAGYGGYDMEMLPHKLKEYLVGAEEIRQDLLNRNQKMFVVCMTFFIMADTKEELQNHVFKVKSVAGKYSCTLGNVDYMKEKALNTVLPVGKNHLDIQRRLTTAATAIFIPFTTQELSEKNGIYYGVHMLSHNLLFFDRKKQKNASGWIFGTPGSGKSFAAKKEMIHVLLSTNDDVIIIDPEREYANLVERFNGEGIRVAAGSKAHINPMDITMDYADDDNPLLLKSEYMLSFCECLIGGPNGLDSAQKTVIDRACRLSYQKYFNNPERQEPPTLPDFYKTLKEQPEPEAKSIALSLELYIEGTLSVFAHPTNVNTDNRLVCYDIKDLGNQLKTIGMLIVLDQIWNRITRNRALGKRTWIYIDEIYLLFQNEYSANYLEQLYKRARKWGAIPTGITQNVEDLLMSAKAINMLSNADFILMFNQAANDRVKLQEILNISDQQIGYVTNSPTGQGLLIAGNSIIPFVDNFPTETNLYKLMTTKPEELSLRKSLMTEQKEQTE